MLIFKDLPSLCLKRFKSTKSPFQKTVILPKTTLPLRRKNISDFEKDLQKVCGFLELYNWQWKSREGEEKFVLHDGPPYANGDVHVGHAMNKILKDIIVRHKMLEGYQVQYIPGWDCHGLPIETKAIKSSESFSLSPLEVRKRARRFARQTSNKQKKVFKRWGITADWENGCYYTFDKNYEVAETNAFFELYKKNLIFRDLKPVNWSPSSKTALAEGELEYNAAHISRSAYISFPLTQHSKSNLGMHQADNVKILSWTTQPWTIPGNKALGYADGVKYCIVKQVNGTCGQAFYVMAVDCIDNVASRLGCTFQIRNTFDSSSLAGCTYHHPMDMSITSSLVQAAHVTTSAGTGVVHLAPGHGAEDFAVARKFNLPTESIVDREGCLNSNAGFGLEGKFIFTEGNDAVIEQLAANDNLVFQHDYTHSYPCDWRTKAPIIIRTSKQWFIETTSFAEKAREACDKVSFLADGGKNTMLSSLSQRDFWCISRQRAWGLPIPTFYCRSTGNPIVTESSINHLMSLYSEDGADVWWKYPISKLLPDHVISQSNLPGTSDDYERGNDILDIWFDSGVSWSAVLGDSSSVADLYLEGRDQYNGWFYSSLMTHLAMGKKDPPFKSLYTHGFALAGDGHKMSKSIGNVVDPLVVTDGGKNLKVDPAYGVDVLRWWVAESNTFNDVRISKEIMNSMQLNVNKIRSSLRFLISNLNDFEAPTKMEEVTLKPIDAYFLSKVHQNYEQITELFESYRFSKAAQCILNTVHTLSRTYFTIVKDRLYCEAKNGGGRLSAQTAMHFMCGLLMKSIAPILPHLVEEVHIHHPCPTASEGESYFKNGWINVTTCPVGSNNEQQLDAVARVLALKSKLVAIDSRPTSDYDITLHTTCPDALHKLMLLHTTEGDCDIREILGCSRFTLLTNDDEMMTSSDGDVMIIEDNGVKMMVSTAVMKPCPRCRLNTSVKAGQPCDRCLDVLSDGWDEEITLYSN